MKNLYIFILCAAVLCAGSIFGIALTATAEQETQIEVPAEREERSAPELESGDAAESEASQPAATSVPPADPEENSESQSSSEAEGGESAQEESQPETPEPDELPEPDEEGAEAQQINPDVAAAMQAAHDSLDAHIKHTAGLLGMSDSYTLTSGEDNFLDALTVYAIRRGQTENFPYAVELAQESDRDELASLYWSLNPVNAAHTDANAVIHIRRLSGKNNCGLTSEEMAEFSALYTDENRAIIAKLLAQ